MMQTFSGVYAAVLTPRTDIGTLNEASFLRQVKFLSSCSIDGFAVNGATGEFPVTSAGDIERTVSLARKAAPQQTLLCGIGGPNVVTTCTYAGAALDAGAHALLLPMPYFFPYRQDDLVEFVSAVVEKIDAPFLLYNLPQFTSGLEVDTVLELMKRHTQIVGIKDSSGSLDIVRALADCGSNHARFIGNDSALVTALREHVCTGVISGVACVLPELMSAFFAHTPGSPKFEDAAELLEQYISSISGLPTPWGLKVTSEMRDIASGVFPMPLSTRRKSEVAALVDWFGPWLTKMGSLLQTVNHEVHDEV
jgi:4-hydroxy-tetrahydrodipicolinate synthase